MFGFIIDIILTIVLFMIIIGLGFAFMRVLCPIVEKIKNNPSVKSSRFLNPKEYLPEEEVFTMKQVFYLILIVLCVFNFLFLLGPWFNGQNTVIFIDLVLSFYLAFQIDANSNFNRVLWVFAMPFASIVSVLTLFLPIPVFSSGILFYMLVEFIHALVFLYFIRVYFRKFNDYTETNSLGITIMLLFLIVFVSFLITIFVESVNPLDSLEMVSNAFTSNGYTILGSSNPGKIDAIFLVWSGFILSGVGTATLIVSIVMRHVDSKFDSLEERIKKNKKD
ncbi:hypothetical protein [Methanobrevibacter sp.]|uniref:hypothetical protein n=1 Tax=Methanobrevibacter sp. TaxID=66852 RepID=UPI003890A8C0